MFVFDMVYLSAELQFVNFTISDVSSRFKYFANILLIYLTFAQRISFKLFRYFAIDDSWCCVEVRDPACCQCAFNNARS